MLARFRQQLISGDLGRITSALLVSTVTATSCDVDVLVVAARKVDKDPFLSVLVG
jgi:uncharacterized protein YccT (UPF0319 family)